MKNIKITLFLYLFILASFGFSISLYPINHSEFEKEDRFLLENAYWSMSEEERERFSEEERERLFKEERERFDDNSRNLFSDSDRSGSVFDWGQKRFMKNIRALSPKLSPELSEGQSNYCTTLARAIIRNSLAGKKAHYNTGYTIYSKCNVSPNSPLAQAMQKVKENDELRETIKSKQEAQKYHERSITEKNKLEKKSDEIKRQLNQLEKKLFDNKANSKVASDGLVGDSKISKYAEKFREMEMQVSDDLLIGKMYFNETKLSGFEDKISHERKKLREIKQDQPLLSNEKAINEYNAAIKKQEQRVSDVQKKKDIYFENRCDLATQVFDLIVASPENLNRFNKALGETCYTFSYFNYWAYWGKKPEREPASYCGYFGCPIMRDHPGYEEWKHKGTLDVWLAEVNKCKKEGLCQIETTKLKTLKQYANVYAQGREVLAMIQQEKALQKDKQASSQATSTKNIDALFQEKERLEKDLQEMCAKI